MAISPQYDSNAIGELTLRTQYEIYLLESAYEIVGMPIFPSFPDQLIYSSNGSAPHRIVYGKAHIRLGGDWKQEFLNVGAPLIFATSFKILDMLLEWVLVKNGEKSTHQFTQKLATLRGGSGLTFPSFIEQRPYLLDRLVELYDQLTPLRGTIVHSHVFSSTEGSVTVSSTRKGQTGAPITISKSQVRDLATLAVSLVHYVTGAWVIHSYGEKRLRRTLDNIQNLHLLSSLGQMEPTKLTVRIFRAAAEQYQIDLSQILDDIAQKEADRDVEFDLRLISVTNDCQAIAYLIPWEMIDGKSGMLDLTTAEISTLVCDIPEGLDLPSIAQDLYGQGNT